MTEYYFRRTKSTQQIVLRGIQIAIQWSCKIRRRRRRRQLRRHKSSRRSRKYLKLTPRNARCKAIERKCGAKIQMKTEGKSRSNVDINECNNLFAVAVYGRIVDRSNSSSSKHWSTAKIFSREMIYCWRFDFTHLLLLCVRSRATPTIGRPLLIEAVERSIWIVSEMQPIFFLSSLCPNVISDAAAEMLTSLAGDRHSVCVTRIETPNTSFSIQLIARVRTLCSLCTEHTNHNRN